MVLPFAVSVNRQNERFDPFPFLFFNLISQEKQSVNMPEITPTKTISFPRAELMKIATCMPAIAIKKHAKNILMVTLNCLSFRSAFSVTESFVLRLTKISIVVIKKPAGKLIIKDINKRYG
jgi:hypothetical protein